MSCARRFSSQNTEAFLSALDRIDAVHREPTPWEAACLFSALGAMASGNERLAEEKIALCGSTDLTQQRAWAVPEGLTVAGLRRALAALSDYERAPIVRSRLAMAGTPRKARKEAAERVFHDTRPTCEWCGRGKLEVVREWRDSSSGVIGVSLQCDSQQCAKLTVV